MKKRIDMIPAPTSPQPGGYVPRAYPDRSSAITPWVDLDLRSSPGLSGRRWDATLRWPCPEPVHEVGSDTDLFVDAAALLAPAAENASWMTMGAPGSGVHGILWRADRGDLVDVRAEGLGTVLRKPAEEGWRADARWSDGHWEVQFELKAWPLLGRYSQIALAVWRGSEAERAGLKSISPGWLEIS